MADPGGATVRLDGKAIDRLLREKDGDVGRFLLRLALKVETEAKRLTGGPLVKVDTGRLRSSITHQIEREGRNLVAWVGSPLEYAYYVHTGRAQWSAPPPVDSIAGWASRHGLAGNEYVIARAISERGIEPKPFLDEAMRVIGG